MTRPILRSAAAPLSVGRYSELRRGCASCLRCILSFPFHFQLMVMFDSYSSWMCFDSVLSICWCNNGRKRRWRGGAKTAEEKEGGGGRRRRQKRWGGNTRWSIGREKEMGKFSIFSGIKNMALAESGAHD
ncbi:hypothetical protein A2U01_0004830 [Trifolium medium]|uniref:Uncharacterized protein n=1 Tax=Trifolium medium TaxID=97028 RepID=A0A392M930_9FABA|nr:hypothetical protein [Trifolium medium]